MNYLKIQTLCLMASLCLAQATIQAGDAATEKMNTSGPRRACYTQVYQAAKAAQSAQNSLTGHNYTDRYDTIFGRCLEARSSNLVFTKSDPRAVTDCLNGAVAIATENNDTATRKFLVQQVVHKKLDKGGPTMAFTFYSPANAFFGAAKGGISGALIGASIAAAFAGGHNYGLWMIGSTSTTTTTAGNILNPLSWRWIQSNTTTTVNKSHHISIKDYAKTGAKAGLIAGSTAGLACGIKVSIDL